MCCFFINSKFLPFLQRVISSQVSDSSFDAPASHSILQSLVSRNETEHLNQHVRN